MSRDLNNSKCQDILTAAKTLFWKHGIKRVSVKEICEKAGASKMTFYRFFDNKMDLVKTILDILVEKGMASYQAIMEEPISFAEKMKKTLIVKFEQSQDISQEFLMDLHKSGDTELVLYVTEKSKISERLFIEDLKKAQAKGEIRADIKMEFILYQVHKIREMIADEKLLALYNNPQELIMEMTNFFFYGLFER